MITVEPVFGRRSAEPRAGASARDRERSEVVADLRRRLGAMDGGSGPGWVDASGGAGASSGDGALDAQRVAGGSPASGVLGASGPASEVLGASGPLTGVLAAPGPLAEVLPQRGIPRGSVVGLASTASAGGATSLLLSLLAAPPDIWAAVVGMPRLGVLAAAEMGVDLGRLGLIPDPGPDVLQVISVLIDGVDVIATVPPANLPPARQRVLTGRLRQQGAVLLVMGRWPGADLTLTVTDVRWSGIGQGHGRLRDRELDVRVGGRRSGAGGSATLLLRSSGIGVSVEHATRASGAQTGSNAPAADAGGGAILYPASSGETRAG